MLMLLLDMVVLWFLLNFMSDENWDDRKMLLFFISLAISLAGMGVGALLAPYIGLFCLGAYVLIGGVILYAMAGLDMRRALQTMSAFLVYKIILVICIIVATVGFGGSIE